MSCLLRVAMLNDDESPPAGAQGAWPPLSGLEFLKCSGRGSTGEVFLARQLALDRIVAVKILPPEMASAPDFLDRFRREARILATFDHPNIVRVFDFGKEDGRAFLVMEYVDGMELRELMRQKMSPQAAIRLVVQLCDALEYAHARGIVHRDIKPENILVDVLGRVKLIDFGLATRPTADGKRPTRPNQVMGSLHYMAPEQYGSAHRAGPAADIYSLGVVLYELLTGELPLGKFPPPSRRAGVDRRVDPIVRRALETDPDRRFGNVSEFRNLLSALNEPAGSRQGLFRMVTVAVAALVASAGAWGAIRIIGKPAAQARRPVPASPAPLDPSHPALLPNPAPADFRLLRRPVYIDRVTGGWLGKMIGTAWGEVTPSGPAPLNPNLIPRFSPELLNAAFDADDLIVSEPSLATLREIGATFDGAALGARFQAATFPVFHGNEAGRANLRKGVAFPDAGHYLRNKHCEDNDCQAVSELAGFICPALPDAAVDLAWRAGHMTNYADGVYGGVFIAALTAAAFASTDLEEIVEAGRRALPLQSGYRRMVEEVLQVRHEIPGDWAAAWEAVSGPWKGRSHCKFDARVQGAVVLISLLYGKGDFEASVGIALRLSEANCCNAGNVGAVLGTWLGASRLPPALTAGLAGKQRFAHGGSTLEGRLKTCEQAAREILRLTGGAASGTGEDEIWRVPRREIFPLLLEQRPTQDNPRPLLEAGVRAGEDRAFTFTASATDQDGIQSYQWFFGDFTHAAGPEARHRYAVPGSFPAVCYVTDKTGNTSWKEIRVDAR